MSPCAKVLQVDTSENTGSTIRPEVVDRKWLKKTGQAFFKKDNKLLVKNQKKILV